MWLAIAVVAIVGIVAAVLATRDDEPGRVAIDVDVLSTTIAPTVTTAAPTPSTSATQAPVTTAAPTTEPSPNSSTAPTTTPDSTAGTSPTTRPAAGDGTTPDGPLPTGTPESVFTYEGFESEWAGQVLGVFPLPTWDPEDGTEYDCYVIVGTLRPTAITGVVSDAFEAPYVEALVGDEPAREDVTCDTEPVTQLGYRSVYEAEATAGTDVAFYTQFTVPKGDLPSVVRVGDDRSFTYFDATPGDDMPEPPAGEVGPLAVEPMPIGPDTPGTFTYRASYLDDEWSGSVTGLVELPVDEYAGRPGTCLGLLFEVTPDVLGEGIVSAGYTTPPVGVIAGGLLVDDHFGCDTTSLDDAGYRWITDAQVTPGTRVAAYTTVFLADPSPGEAVAIVVGDSWGESEVAVFEPLLLDEAPPAPVVPGEPAGVETVPVGTAVETTHDWDDSDWEITLHGLVPTGATSFADEGACVTLVADVTKVAGEDDTAAPYPYLLVGGYLLDDTYQCDVVAVEEAGYVQWFQGTAGEGETAHVYAQFLIPAGLTGEPELIMLGDPTGASGVYVAATAIDAYPAPGE